MKLHDEIKKKYERGKYDQQIKDRESYSNPDQLGWYRRIIRMITPVWFILLIASFLPASYSMARNIMWLHYIFMVLWVLNTIGVIYCFFKIRKLNHSTQSK